WVALSCQDGATTWICITRNATIALFKNWVFGTAALGVAVLNLIRPSLLLFAVAMVAAAFGIVLYNIGASGLAAALLLLSLLRAPQAPQSEREAEKHGAKPKRLPIREALVRDDIEHASSQQRRDGGFRRAAAAGTPGACERQRKQRHQRRRHRSEGEIAVAGIEHEP